ncbi:hypothetical protein PTSG_03414 [Salpingoeca rosetta]|uniref:Uncharacterized protein n=1 Tax=Salpingoeca rosetta (strain ATCC 50818 / BSB-021) TaxID=946362 RepID=F2U548_SALR5|nr:uncharacterized protein PTSG_03414 [Salpingoeca rosetta]EGD82764.1 hypothetical protein PTSG_03414 [Salpingoeca rosetta]|eukprot:XP_004996000.1 hypothetical protein PTSG_03414 [Salpingoeca rosetta]
MQRAQRRGGGGGRGGVVGRGGGRGSRGKQGSTPELELLHHAAHQDEAWLQTARDQLPGALELCQSSTMGNGVIANPEGPGIRDGDLIMSETVDCFVICQDSYDVRCHGCLAANVDLVPCDCEWAHFCHTCDSNRDAVHTQMECRVFQQPEFEDLPEPTQEYVRLALRIWYKDGVRDRIQRALCRSAHCNSWPQWQLIRSAADFVAGVDASVDRLVVVDCLLRAAANCICIMNDIRDEVGTAHSHAECTRL